MSVFALLPLSCASIASPASNPADLNKTAMQAFEPAYDGFDMEKTKRHYVWESTSEQKT